MLSAYLASDAAIQQSTDPDISGGDFEISAPEPPQFHAPVMALPSIASICRDVAEKYGLTVAQLESQSRIRPIAHPRQEVMWRAYQIRRWDGSRRYSTTMIGRYWKGKGGRTKGLDHSTVIHSLRAYEKRARIILLDQIAFANAQAAQVHGGQA